MNNTISRYKPPRVPKSQTAFAAHASGPVTEPEVTRFEVGSQVKLRSSQKTVWEVVYVADKQRLVRRNGREGGPKNGKVSFLLVSEDRLIAYVDPELLRLTEAVSRTLDELKLGHCDAQLHLQRAENIAAHLMSVGVRFPKEPDIDEEEPGMCEEDF